MTAFFVSIFFKSVQTIKWSYQKSFVAFVEYFVFLSG